LQQTSTARKEESLGSGTAGRVSLWLVLAIPPRLRAQYEPLLWLQNLVNRDKHRALLLTIGEVDNVTIHLSPWHLSDVITETEKITIPRNLATQKQPAFQSDMPLFDTLPSLPASCIV
jgi:hypothetical protein